MIGEGEMGIFSKTKSFIPPAQPTQTKALVKYVEKEVPESALIYSYRDNDKIQKHISNFITNQRNKGFGVGAVTGGTVGGGYSYASGDRDKKDIIKKTLVGSVLGGAGVATYKGYTASNKARGVLDNFNQKGRALSNATLLRNTEDGKRILSGKSEYELFRLAEDAIKSDKRKIVSPPLFSFSSATLHEVGPVYEELMKRLRPYQGMNIRHSSPFPDNSLWTPDSERLRSRFLSDLIKKMDAGAAGKTNPNSVDRLVSSLRDSGVTPKEFAKKYHPDTGTSLKESPYSRDFGTIYKKLKNKSDVGGYNYEYDKKLDELVRSIKVNNNSKVDAANNAYKEIFKL